MDCPKRPDHFYKYRSLAVLDQVKDILLNNRLYWSSPTQFNDPFDCAAIPVMAEDPHVRRDYARRIIANNMAGAPKRVRREVFRELSADNMAKAEAAMPGIFKERLGAIGVCSLAEDPNNILMWSHYANSHTGICLQFSPDVDDFEMFPLPVIYASERPVVDMAGDRDHEWAERVLLHKADYWAYEREWRAIDVKGSGLHPFPAEYLDAVYFGTLIDTEDRALVTRWSQMRRAPTKLFQMRFDDREFRLHADEIR